jgi:hypothetical protein
MDTTRLDHRMTIEARRHAVTALSGEQVRRPTSAKEHRAMTADSSESTRAASGGATPHEHASSWGGPHETIRLKS